VQVELIDEVAAAAGIGVDDVGPENLILTAARGFGRQCPARERTSCER
jgi:hypothetical protein